MAEAHQKTALVPVAGKLPALSAKNLSRLSVYVVEGNKVVAEVPVAANGAFRLKVSEQLASRAGAHAVLAPRKLDAEALAAHSELPRIALSSAARSKSGAINVDFARLNINDELILSWWYWCREYTISGTLDTAANCPVPGAQVTIYYVTTGTTGLVETPITTVTTGVDGTFTATFPWCSRRCWWPCWPVWWFCWPWWWELDILAVLESVEGHIAARAATGAAKLRPRNVAPLRQPEAIHLATGQAFAGSHASAALQPSAARTALIASKFADPAIREIFPYWWWCCENPNIVFRATQGANTILDEDPNTSTRWCFASGQSVTLTTNSLAVGVCQVQTPPGDHSFIWTSVGQNIHAQVLASQISEGYANGTAGSDASNLAFAGSLDLCGNLSSDIVFYQVEAALYGGDGNPARGGTPPGAASPLALPVQLINYVTIRRADNSIDQPPVVLGPCSFNGHDNLYMTPNQRQNAPAGVTGLGAFPTLNPGDTVEGWSSPNLVLTAPAAALVPTGGISLTVNAFDIGGNSITLDPQVPLDLMIDTTGVSSALHLVGVFNSDGTPADQVMTGVCPAYQIATAAGGYVLFHANVNDPNGHVCGYSIAAYYGDGSLPGLTITPASRGYAQAAATFTPSPAPNQPGVDPGYGVPNNGPYVAPSAGNPQPQNWSYVGGGDLIQINVTRSCCYDFQLSVSKRVTDGETFACAGGVVAYQTVNITVA